MDTLVQNITGTCPLAFAGDYGALFAHTIAAMITAHCAIVDNKWPEDNAAEVLAQNGPKSYDFIIVGAGTAGSMLASRLSENFPEKTVLLIEAGHDPGLNSEVPMFLFQNKDISWNYKTEPNDQSCLGFQNQSCVWSKGRAMGGSSSINAMLYIRGHPTDFENWKKLGNKNWGYDDVQPYFERLEDRFKLSNIDIDREEAQPLYDFYAQAWNELGFKAVTDKNAVTGTRTAKLLVANGMRKNTAKIVLEDVRELPNLIVMKNTIVQKVCIDATSRAAISVEVMNTKLGVHVIKANHEVILSAGSVASPQILMLSGIGPKEHLQEKGIELIAELPVGQNLQDHVVLPLLFQINSSYSESWTQDRVKNVILNYLLNKRGPLSSVGISDFMAFVNAKNKSDYPDLQFHHTFFPKNDQFLLKRYFTDLGYSQVIVPALIELNRHNDLLGIYPTLLHPKSRGEILLKNTNPKSHPVIKANYFTDTDDLKMLLHGIRLAQKLLLTQPFKALGVTIPKLNMKYCEENEFNTDDYWECYIKHIGTTIYHPVGTAKMGPASDRTAVLNDDLQVKGIKKLRVVDASIMPTIVGGNTMAATLIIAEKAFDIIKKAYMSAYKDEL